MTKKGISLREELRLRIFAGPNGSGKSTIIESVRSYKSAGKNIKFGYYVNADDIAKELKQHSFNFGNYGLDVKNQEFKETAITSGLIGEGFNEDEFIPSYSLHNNILKAKNKSVIDRIAQIIADFLRKKLLEKRERFSFETVFSHPSKLDIMKEASEAGYKVYLYFVSTESPKINKFRVKARKNKGGHDVPEDKIVSRYYRSLELMYDACQVAYQVYFFDNSVNGRDFKMFAHFKKDGRHKVWDRTAKKDYPEWFKRYYSAKIAKK